MKDFTAADVEVAHDELRRHVQKLVDRFGQAQAYEILLGVGRATCPDGMMKAPKFYCVSKEESAVN